MESRKLSPIELEKLRRAFENWDKPLSPPKAVPKSEKKKRGRPSKEDNQ